MFSAPPVIGIRDQGALDLVQTLLRQGVFVRIRASGNSMRPLLKGGEVIELGPLQDRSPQLGDILFIRSQQDNPFVHRLIWRRRRGGALHLLTKGDACAGFDGFFPAECALGRVERIMRNRTISLQTPLMRLRAFLIVSRAIGRHAVRKLKRM
jgi:hypothetical protein